MRFVIENCSDPDRKKQADALGRYVMELGKISDYLKTNSNLGMPRIKVLRSKTKDERVIYINGPNVAVNNAFFMSVLTASYFLGVHKEEVIETLMEEAYEFVQKDKHSKSIMDVIAKLQLDFAKYVNENKIKQVDGDHVVEHEAVLS